MVLIMFFLYYDVYTFINSDDTTKFLEEPKYIFTTEKPLMSDVFSFAYRKTHFDMSYDRLLTGKYTSYYKFNLKHFIQSMFLRLLGINRLVYRMIIGLYGSRGKHLPTYLLCKMTRFSLSRRIVYFDGKWRLNPNLYRAIISTLKFHNPTMTNSEIIYHAERLEILFKKEQQIFEVQWTPSLKLPGKEDTSHMAIYNMIKYEYGLPIISNKIKGEMCNYYNKDILAKKVITFKGEGCILIEKNIIPSNKFFMIKPYYIYTAEIYKDIKTEIMTDHFQEKKFKLNTAFDVITKYGIESGFNQETIKAIIAIPNDTNLLYF